MADLTTTTTLLDGDQARIDVVVPSDRFEHDVEHTLHHLSDSVKIPGFRKGRVPTRLVMQRLGREEVVAETLREHLTSWYSEGVQQSRLHVYDRPTIDYDSLPAEGEPFQFSATVRLRPKGTFAPDLTIEAPREQMDVPVEAVEAELERLRITSSPLVEVSGRPAQAGDFVELDVTVSVGGRVLPASSVQGYHVELGIGRALPEIESVVVGMSPGEHRETTMTLPDDHADKKLAGKQAELSLTLHRIQERVPRELDDSVARDTSEFDTLAELRSDIEGSLRDAIDHEISARFRAAVLQALGDAVRVSLPPELIEDKVDEIAVALSRSLARRGATLAQYLQMTGQSADDLRRMLDLEAADELRKEIALEAYAEFAGVQLDDAELERELTKAAVEEDEPIERVQELMASGAKEHARDELRLRRALDIAVEAATPITVEQAEARGKLWTPTKDTEQRATPELWTPSSR